MRATDGFSGWSRTFLLVSLIALSLIMIVTVAGCDDEGIQRAKSTSQSDGWQQMSSGTSVTLRDVWGSSATDVFAVGDDGTILHFDGARWSAMPSGTTEHLHGVTGTARADAYVGGDNGTALHFDGNTWTRLDPPTTNDLAAVDAGWVEYVWTGGLTFIDREDAGYVYLYEPNPQTWSRFLMGDAVFNDATWVSEYPGDPEALKAGLFVGEGGEVVYFPRSYDSLVDFEVGTADLVSVFGGTLGNMFMLDTEGVLWQFRGGGEAVAVASTGVTMTDGAQGSYSDVFLVGLEGRIFRYDRCGLGDMASGTGADLLSVWAEPDDAVFAVGEEGTILRYTDSGMAPCPDNVTVTVGPGARPEITWLPPCPVSKVIVTDLSRVGYEGGNWFLAADGNHIAPGVRIGDVPDCSVELHPAISPLEPGSTYQLRIVRRDLEGDLTIGLFNFTLGEAPQVLEPAPAGLEAVSDSRHGVLVQRLHLIIQPEPGSPFGMEFGEVERWSTAESSVNRAGHPDEAASIRSLIRDPETGAIQIHQIDDVPVMTIGNDFWGNTKYAVRWPQFSP